MSDAASVDLALTLDKTTLDNRQINVQRSDPEKLKIQAARREKSAQESASTSAQGPDRGAPPRGSGRAPRGRGETSSSARQQQNWISKLQMRHRRGGLSGITTMSHHSVSASNAESASTSAAAASSSSSSNEAPAQQQHESGSSKPVTQQDLRALFKKR